MNDSFENKCLLLAIILAIATCLYVEYSNPCAAWSDTPCEYRGSLNG